MKNKLLRRLAALGLLLTLLVALVPEAVAEDGQTADELLAAFMAENGLDETNFSVCYYNTVTGESCRFNETHMMVAASTFKLPLNMYYYELQNAGELCGTDHVAGMQANLDECHYQSIVNSNNEISIGMLYNLGNFSTYKQLMRKYFSMTDEEIDPVYYQNNYYCTRMMIDALQYLYENQDSFTEMLDYMKQACPGAYFQRYITDCDVAHKYGSFEGAENDTGIIFAEQPFLLAVYTQGLVGEEICAQTALLFKDYTDAQTLAEPEAEPEEQPEPVAEGQVLEFERLPVELSADAAAEEPEMEAQPEAVPAEQAQVPVITWWMIAVAVGIVLLALLVLRGTAHSRAGRQKKLEEKYDPANRK